VYGYGPKEETGIQEKYPAIMSNEGGHDRY